MKKFTIYVEPSIFEEYPEVIKHFAFECMSTSSRKTKKGIAYKFETQEHGCFFYDMLIDRFSEGVKEEEDDLEE